MRRRRSVTPLAWGGAACVALALAGCGSLGPDSGAAADVAAEFHAAVADGDGARACGLLAPAVVEQLEDDAAAACADAVVEAEVPEPSEVVETHAYGRQAQVVTARDVVFLTASGGRWLITAAGCTPRPDRPYDCGVSGS